MLNSQDNIERARKFFESCNYQKHLSNSNKELFKYCSETYLHEAKEEISIVDIRSALHKDFSWYPQKRVDHPDSNYSFRYLWYPTDSLETFEEHMKDSTTASLLEKMGYGKKQSNAESMFYDMNNLGFRCKNFNDDPGIVFLGCSFTLGIGVEQNATFPEVVSKHFNVECWNLGMPGKGADIPTLYASLFMRQEITNIKAIVMTWPPLGRASIIDRDRILNFHDESDSKNLIRYFCSSNTNNFIRNMHYNAVLQQIADELNVPYISTSTQEIYNYGTLWDMGRDLSHFGRMTHRQIANNIIKKLDK
jgi:hypothetical protein